MVASIINVWGYDSLYICACRQGNLVVRTQRVDDTEYVIDKSDLPPGEFQVSVAVVLGDQNSAATGEGDASSASSRITIPGEPMLHPYSSYPPPPHTHPTLTPSLSEGGVTCTRCLSYPVDVYMAALLGTYMNMCGTEPYTVLHTKRQELSHFDILWIFSCNELCTQETYHHDSQPLPVNLITIT